MKIAILAAMDKELQLLLAQMDNVTEVEDEGLRVFRGTIGSHTIAAAKCGIGKVNSAISTYRLIRNEQPDIVINSGVAGGADTSMEIGTVLVPTEVSYHDVWCGPGTEYGAADGFPCRMVPDSRVTDAARRLFGADPSVRFGLICSGDKFISTPEEIEEIKRHFPDALACDMESAAIAQTCGMLGVPFAILRVVSDTPGSGHNIDQYQDFWTKAPERTFAALREVITSF